MNLPIVKFISAEPGKHGAMRNLGCALALTAGFAATLLGNPTGRLYVKYNGLVAAAIDPQGNFFTRGSADGSSSFPHGGLEFKQSGVIKFSIREENASDPSQRGKIIMDYPGLVSPGGSGNFPAGSILFKNSGTTKAGYDVSSGYIYAMAEYAGRCGYRKNAASLTTVEKQDFIDAVYWADHTYYPGTPGVPGVGAPGYPGNAQGVSVLEQYPRARREDFSEEHDNPAFLPWHRKFLNVVEDTLRLYDPLLSLTYWDWQTDPRTSGIVGPGGFMGSDEGRVGFPFDFLDNNGVLAGSYDEAGEVAYPVQLLDRYLLPGAPQTASDATLLQEIDYGAFETGLEGAGHNTAHIYLATGTAPPDAIPEVGGGNSPIDPIFFLLHTNVDRIWAAWQDMDPQRMQTATVYGSASDNAKLQFNLEPWSGGPGMIPWLTPKPETYWDPEVVNHRLYY